MDHTRHSDIFDASKTSITLIGAGGIGSPTAIALAKMGVGMLRIIDDDIVSDVNMPTQIHRLSDIGLPKPHALYKLLMELADDTQFDLVTTRLQADGNLHDFIVISAVDSIKSRKGIWEAVKSGMVRWYLEARMGAEEFQLNVVDMKDYAWYENALATEDDSLIPDLPCTSKATVYCGMLAGALIANAVKKIIVKQANPCKLVVDLKSNTMFSLG